MRIHGRANTPFLSAAAASVDSMQMMYWLIRPPSPRRTQYSDEAMISQFGVTVEIYSGAKIFTSFGPLSSSSPLTTMGK